MTHIVHCLNLTKNGLAGSGFKVNSILIAVWSGKLVVEDHIEFANGRNGVNWLVASSAQPLQRGRLKTDNSTYFQVEHHGIGHKLARPERAEIAGCALGRIVNGTAGSYYLAL